VKFYAGILRDSSIPPPHIKQRTLQPLLLASGTLLGGIFEANPIVPGKECTGLPEVVQVRGCKGFLMNHLEFVQKNHFERREEK